MQVVYTISSVQESTICIMLFTYYKAYMSHIGVKFVLILPPYNVLCYAIALSGKKDQTFRSSLFLPDNQPLAPYKSWWIYVNLHLILTHSAYS